MNNLMDGLQNFQAQNRAKIQEWIDEAVFKAQEDDIIKATAAMMEANIEDEKISALLLKYWNLRPSEVTYFLDKSKEL